MKRAIAIGAALVAAALGIALVQAPLAKKVQTVKSLDDAYALPPPTAVRALALGYDSAGADLLWAKLLLEYGTHWADRKYFREAPLFIDDIIALDPKHRVLYTYVDTILIYQPTNTNVSRGDEQDCRAARRYLERGVAEFPYDGELWLKYGQFIAFMGPAYLPDEAEWQRWRVDGARAMTRAMELGVRVDRTMSAPAMLGRNGETKAQIAYLTQAYALTDDPQERAQIAARLGTLQSDVTAESASRVLRLVEQTWKSTFPYLSRGDFLLMSPAPNAALCAGPARATDLDCATTWDTVGQRIAP